MSGCVYESLRATRLCGMQHPHVAQVEALPYHRYLGLRVLESSEGRGKLELPITEANANAMNVLHGGVLYTVCDVASYLALVSLLPHDHGAVTHDLHVSCMRPGGFGETLLVEAEVVRQGRSVAFMDARARIGDKLIATARVTKSIMKLG